MAPANPGRLHRALGGEIRRAQATGIGHDDGHRRRRILREVGAQLVTDLIDQLTRSDAPDQVLAALDPPDREFGELKQALAKG